MSNATPEQLAERAIFAQGMKKQMGEKKLISTFDFEKIKELAGYSIRRLAYWIRSKTMNIARECMNAFKNAGVLGMGKAKVSRKLHFV